MFSKIKKIFELDKITLNLLLYQKNLIFTNIININNLNYKSKDINFKEAFREAVKQRQKNIHDPKFKINFSKIKLILRKKNIFLKNNIKKLMIKKNIDIEKSELLKNSILYKRCITAIKEREEIFTNALEVF